MHYSYVPWCQVLLVIKVNVVFLITAFLCGFQLIKGLPVIELQCCISNYSYAPWCPACKGFTETWIKFGDWSGNHGNNFKVGKIDVTQNAGEFVVIIN